MNMERIVDQSEKLLLKSSNESENIDSFEEFYRKYERTDETQCGIWIFKYSWLQPLASKKLYTILYGIVGCMYSACFAYYKGTITTIEKQLKISSRTTGVISIANNLSQTFITLFLSYYISKKNNPRFVALGALTSVCYCFFNFLPYLVYGPGDDSLKLTHEFGDQWSESNLTQHGVNNNLCSENRTVSSDCGGSSNTSIESTENLSKYFMFLGNFISGIGGSLITIIGMTYIDNNVNKAAAPVIISFTVFIRLLGPTLGLSLASYCLSHYVVPTLTPIIDKTDVRWIGAWWMGWLVIGGVLFIPAFLISMFPKALPRSKARKEYKLYLLRMAGKTVEVKPQEQASLLNLKKALIRILTNKVYIFNNIAAIFYAFGFQQLMFMPKYMESQFRISASASSVYTGTIHLAFQAIGVLISGACVSKLQPKARSLALWNIISSLVRVTGFLLYSTISCSGNDIMSQSLTTQNIGMSATCDITSCNCDFIKFSPVCGADNITYISPCHAGCFNKQTFWNGTTTYSDCSCVTGDMDLNFATPGRCSIDCTSALYAYLAVVAVTKFIGGTESAINLLLGVRSVDEQDKAVSFGLKMMMMNFFSLVPGPIIFGWLFDKTCIVWGKTCSGKGNCWLYDTIKMRKYLNYTSALCFIIGTSFDCFVWYYAKNVEIFDKKDDQEQNTIEKEINKTN